jgi:hypothetical protein
MKLTDQQRKGLWIGGIVLVLIHFAPDLLRALHQPTQQPKPSAARTIAPAPAVPPIPPIDPQFAILQGHWMGTYLKPKYICDTKLELKANPVAPEPFTGYTTMSCHPTDINAAIRPGKPVNWIETMIKAQTPASAIYTGRIEGPSIQLHLTQSIGKQEVGCQPTAYTLTPFGDSQLAAKWDEKPCEEGQVVMKRTLQ